MRAAVYREPNQPLTIETVTLDDPAERELLVRTVATGVCHSDLHIAEGIVVGGRGALVLGHEGAGVVEAVGPGVRGIEVGDHVVTCLSGFCGTCEMCLSGHPNVCVANPTGRPRGSTPRMSQGDGRVSAFIGIGSFAEKMLVHEHSVVRIDPDLPLEVACLVGCGVLTGVGAALRTAGVQAGESVAVFGCGGVGLSIVQGAALAGAGQIIAVDRVADKLELARSLGATDVVDASSGDAVAAVRELTGGRGVDHALEAVGLPQLVRQAAESLAVRGTCTIVGVPADGTVFEIPYAAIRPECKVQTCRMGSNRFRVDIPRYLDFYRKGRLRLDEMVTRRGRLEDVNDAFAAMHAGEGARTVLTFD
ncbi:MAG: Zn-dependent alcohol dehydrogenase [Acidimicrobiia bacterium]|nr:Zn-dependent alcohol dehydrogenase [Acidimicrobiia bacterium]